MADTMNEVVYNIVRNHISEHRGVTNFTTQVELVETTVRECVDVLMARYMGDNNREDMEVRRCVEAVEKHFGVE